MVVVLRSSCNFDVVLGGSGYRGYLPRHLVSWVGNFLSPLRESHSFI